jgi:hypothetical protein
VQSRLVNRYILRNMRSMAARGSDQFKRRTLKRRHLGHAPI